MRPARELVMRVGVILVISAFALGVLSTAQGQRRSKMPSPDEVAQRTPSYKPKDGFVPDAATAVRIAEAVLIPIYGEQKVASERPFKATLQDGVWTVVGTLPPNFMGGTALVRIAKADGRILYLIHEA